jgi:hypothetical protein
MHKNIRMHDIPPYFDIKYSEEAFSLTLSLHPLAERFFETILQSENPHLCEIEKKYNLRAFSSPRSDTFGYGACFQAIHDTHDEEWSVWRCHLPKSAFHSELVEIIASLHCIVIIMSIFDTDICMQAAPYIPQMFCIDSLSFESLGLNSGDISFSYSQHILAYCKNHRTSKKLKNNIIHAMRTTYTRLCPHRDASSDYFDFEIAEGTVPHPYFKCPGNCACIKPVMISDTGKGGMQYTSHNVDSKIQQITLLVGIITLAQIVRQASEKTLTTVSSIASSTVSLI